MVEAGKIILVAPAPIIGVEKSIMLERSLLNMNKK